MNFGVERERGQQEWELNVRNNSIKNNINDDEECFCTPKTFTILFNFEAIVESIEYIGLFIAVQSKWVVHKQLVLTVKMELAQRFGHSNLIGAKKWRKYVKKKSPAVKAFEGAPQRKAIVESVVIRQPRKPSSAKRQCVRARIRKNDKLVFAYIPFEKYPLSKWNRVLLEGWRSSDVPYCHSRCIRGKFDLPPPQKRGSSKKPSRKRLKGKKKDKVKKLRARYFQMKLNVVPDIYSFMV
ncbi:mitochondrial ribosomal protein S12 precursor [Reticulomyxa filosa]|uniref:Mitochondrial ribosomal protein S12 n=1 Tax=Reticulomyxa filosa TaxID=46433 RepID=X6P2Y2_RETFI|nr:mitochondrial ribosomal protein S12 precursor [Reticulomyxa filosa]|eukprot:ETO32493.1 mitochondrial ribosomal protein S12 precursor [Reticulomyxa filosa]